MQSLVITGDCDCHRRRKLPPPTSWIQSSNLFAVHGYRLYLSHHLLPPPPPLPPLSTFHLRFGSIPSRPARPTQSRRAKDTAETQRTHTSSRRAEGQLGSLSLYAQGTHAHTHAHTHRPSHADDGAQGHRETRRRPEHTRTHAHPNDGGNSQCTGTGTERDYGTSYQGLASLDCVALDCVGAAASTRGTDQFARLDGCNSTRLDPLSRLPAIRRSTSAQTTNDGRPDDSSYAHHTRFPPHPSNSLVAAPSLLPPPRYLLSFASASDPKHGATCLPDGASVSNTPARTHALRHLTPPDR